MRHVVEAEQPLRIAAADDFAEGGIAELQVQFDRRLRGRVQHVGHRAADRAARTDHQDRILAGRTLGAVRQPGGDAFAEFVPALRHAGQRAGGPGRERRAEGAPVVRVVAVLMRAMVGAAGVGAVQRLAVVLVEARMGFERQPGTSLAHRRQDLAGGVLLAHQGAGDHATEAHPALDEIFAEPARLLPALCRQAVVIGSAEGGLAVAHEK